MEKLHNPFDIEARAMASAARVSRNVMAQWVKLDGIVVPPVDAGLGRGRRYGIVNVYELALLRRLTGHATLRNASRIIRQRLHDMLVRIAADLRLEEVPGIDAFHREHILEASDFYKATADKIYWVMPSADDGECENALYSLGAGTTLGEISETLAMVDGFCVIDLSDVVASVNEKLFGSRHLPDMTGYAD